MLLYGLFPDTRHSGDEILDSSHIAAWIVQIGTTVAYRGQDARAVHATLDRMRGRRNTWQARRVNKGEKGSKETQSPFCPCATITLTDERLARGFVRGALDRSLPGATVRRRSQPLSPPVP